MKMQVDTLVLEVTRRCNMSCAHCMRGDAQCKDMTREVVDSALENITSIGSLTFTGGEPSLNVDIMNYTLKQVKERNIDVFGFYLVTNGKAVTEEFLLACMRWHAYAIKCSGCNDDYCGVALSQDQFHEPIPKENVRMLQTLKCYHPEDKHTDFGQSGVLAIGRGAFLTDVPTRIKWYQCLPKSFVSSLERAEDSCTIDTMVVTVDGTILSDCDYAYNSIDHLKVGSVFDTNWLLEHIKNYCHE